MSNKKKEEAQDFLAVIKLVSGEEIISTVTSSEEDDRTLLLLDNPVIFESVMIKNMTMGAIKVIPWVQAASDTILILDMDKVITCLLYTSPSPRDQVVSRMPSSA